MFGKSNSDNKNFYEEISNNFQPKNGNKHILLLRTYAVWSNKSISVNNQYDSAVNDVLNKMQENGYEIISIEISPMIVTGNGANEGTNTLITYK
ncbi:hypothetical protein [Oenococcus oeni]|uniref:hypothetical protein n=1 Tax=Oenococcus oeni TaxID=1247 RepID=UPI0010B44BB8|nr:hypothetical protein [Oenococcus oeni]SYW19519.1 hypothetical protein OENI_160067 [Oenococcus oeni]